MLAKVHQNRYFIFWFSYVLLTLVLVAYRFILTEMQILNLAHNKLEIDRRVHAVIDKFAERGLRSLAVAYQVQDPAHLCLLLIFSFLFFLSLLLFFHLLMYSFMYCTGSSRR